MSDESLDLDILRALDQCQALDTIGLVERIGIDRGLVRIAQSCESLQVRGLIFLDTGRAGVPSASPSWKLTVTGRLELRKHEGGADRVASG